MSKYKAGSYKIIADGYLHDLPVKFTFSDDQITGIEIKPGTKLHGLEKQALPQVIDRILTEQTPDIDAVTGATVSSDGLTDALTDVIDQMPATVSKY
ncbi:FMN-binding protein [Lactiplantibacillus garii]|uniref:FMN-binding protein n=1 Tax=Lactiplantibacillus garii TaxID=2306423 RepID=A0A426D8M0_9LACO|nr:FMN-binding protein [Lactiplantibacillus garii]RRK10906.1 FMN-binding protein [Lactiplantibacillus garii]